MSWQVTKGTQAGEGYSMAGQPLLVHGNGAIRSPHILLTSPKQTCLSPASTLAPVNMIVPLFSHRSPPHPASCPSCPRPSSSWGPQSSSSLVLTSKSSRIIPNCGPNASLMIANRSSCSGPTLSQTSAAQSNQGGKNLRWSNCQNAFKLNKRK